MLARFALMLVFVWQPLWPSAGRSGPSQECAPASCCTTIETVSCCGESVIERVCGKTGGECLCASAPTDVPTPGREAPHPRNDRETIVAAPVTASRIFALWHGDAGHRALSASHAALLGGKSHNQVRALLGVWRT